jgi:hypothetical protein
VGLSTINLAVDTNPDGSPFYESILVEVLGENRYRVAASPGLAEGMAAGDEIELAPDEALGYRLLKRGGNISVQFFWDAGDIKQCLRETPRRESGEVLCQAKETWIAVELDPD